MTIDTVDEMPCAQKKEVQPLAVRERAVSVLDDGSKRLDIKKVLQSSEGRTKLVNMTMEISRFPKE